jgi:hypothetical protein
MRSPKPARPRRIRPCAPPLNEPAAIRDQQLHRDRPTPRRPVPCEELRPVPRLKRRVHLHSARVRRVLDRPVARLAVVHAQRARKPPCGHPVAGPQRRPRLGKLPPCPTQLRLCEPQSASPGLRVGQPTMAAEEPDGAPVSVQRGLLAVLTLLQHGRRCCFRGVGGYEGCGNSRCDCEETDDGSLVGNGSSELGLWRSTTNLMRRPLVATRDSRARKGRYQHSRGTFRLSQLALNGGLRTVRKGPCDGCGSRGGASLHTTGSSCGSRRGASRGSEFRGGTRPGSSTHHM